jgi:hypothetical protein
MFDLEKDKFVMYKGLISKDIAKIAEQHCLFQMLNNFHPEPEYGQVPGTHSVHGDSLTESLLLYVQPQVEDITGMKLIPTYSYYRVYKPGDILKDHTDRPASEFSATVTLGFKYNNVADDYRYSLHGYVNNEKRYFRTEPGDAVIYKGNVTVHGRDRFDVGEYSYHAQVSLHYIHADGPYAKEHIYDGRPGIGYIKKV